MEQKSDLRIIKTRRAIRSAFMELILSKPVHKITVTELAGKAEISKGTFYLHYSDIYDLYNNIVEETAAKVAESFDPYPDLFADPAAFVRTFMFAQAELFEGALTRAERIVLSARNIRFSAGYPKCFVNAFKAQIYRVGKLAPCPENDMKLEFLITGMLSILIQYPALASHADQKEVMIQYLSSVIQDTFPEYCCR